MLRKLIAGAALSTLFATGAAAGAAAQPPSPGEIVHRVDRGVRHAVTSVDRSVRRGRYRTRRTVHDHYYRTYGTTTYSARALCNDGRIHYGRTRVSACWTHGGIR